jgi:hypothetical protein
VVEAFANGEEMILHRVEELEVVRAEMMPFVELEDGVRPHGEQGERAAEVAEIVVNAIVEPNVIGRFFARRVNFFRANPKYFAGRECP